MAVDFLNPQSTIVKGNTNGASAAGSKNKVISSSADVSGIELRMLPPLIKDNHTKPFFPFPGFAKLYCLTIVISDVANQLAGAIDLKGFPRIGDNEYLPINKTVFYWQSGAEGDKAPNQVHVFCSVLKSKQGLRDTGKLLSSIKDDAEYKGLVGSLAKLAKNAAKLNVVTDIMVQLAGIAGKYMGNVEDKPIGTVINSYTTLHGDFDTMGITPLLYYTGDADFKFEVVVRNKVEEEKLTKAFGGNGTAKRKPAKEEGEEVLVEMEPL